MMIKGRADSQRLSETLQVRVMILKPPLKFLYLCLCASKSGLPPLSCLTGSPHYSEDFEDEENGKEVCG